MKQKLPKFRSKEEAAIFWEHHEVLDFVEPDEFKVVDPKKGKRYGFANPKKRDAKKLISLRIDRRLLEKAKAAASRRQVGYQSILRVWLERGAPA